MYTYEKKKCSKTVNTGVCYGVIRTATGKYTAWVILDPAGKKIAEATSESNANLIVTLMNGVN